MAAAGTALPAAAQAADPATVDVSANLLDGSDQVAPGNVFSFDASSRVVPPTGDSGSPGDSGNSKDSGNHGDSKASGDPRDSGSRAAATNSADSPGELTVRLPEGITYDRALDSPDDCTPSADRRTVHCPMSPGDYIAGGQLQVKVDKNVPPGTTLTYSATVHVPGILDPNPQNDTASRSVLVKPGPDLSLRWEGPTTVHPGPGVVTTNLVVTNRGPGAAAADFVVVADWPLGVDAEAKLFPRCGPDIFEWECSLGLLRPGQSVVLAFPWSIGAQAVGKSWTMRVDDVGGITTDPTPEDDQPTITIRVVRDGDSTSGTTGTAGPTGTPTPTTTTGTTAGTTAGTSTGATGTAGTTGTAGATGTTGSTPGSGQLASTGAGSGTTALVLSASAALLLGGALAAFVRLRTRRPRLHV